MVTKTKKSSVKKAKRAERYGMVKVKDGQKAHFVSSKNKHGLSLGLKLDDRTVWLRNTRFSSEKAVMKALSLVKFS